jgi:ankyrin repeat protein
MEAVVKLLLETGKVEMDSKDSKHGRTPLSWAAGSWAAQNGREAVVKLLLETSKVDVDSKDSEYGRTLLSWAALTGYEGDTSPALAGRGRPTRTGHTLVRWRIL